jgi:hypothetical protein
MTDARADWGSMTDEELARHCSSEMGACLEELVGRYEERIVNGQFELPGCVSSRSEVRLML